MLSYENLWYQDTSHDWNAARVKSKGEEQDQTNEGFNKRCELASGGQLICLRGTLATDLSSSGVALIPGVSIGLELDYSENTFCLHSNVAQANTTFHVEFKSVELILTRYDVK